METSMELEIEARFDCRPLSFKGPSYFAVVETVRDVIAASPHPHS